MSQSLILPIKSQADVKVKYSAVLRGEPSTGETARQSREERRGKSELDSWCSETVFCRQVPPSLGQKQELR